MKPTYEQLEQELVETKQKLVETNSKLERTTDLLKQALDRIIALEEKLKLNSKNSSKPPSTDPKGNTSSGSKKDREPRKGVSRTPYPAERVDHQIECSRDCCAHCGSGAIELLDVLPKILQQVELPEVRAIVTEYLLRKYRCHSCGKRSVADLPEGTPDSVFGSKLMGLFAHLTGVCHLAKREAIQLIKDLYDVDIGLGSASNIEERVSKALDPVYQRIHKIVIEGEFCKHFDETGWRDSGKKHYVWLASSKIATFFMIHPNRSKEAFTALLKGENPSDFAAVTDRYATYNTIDKLHQFCLAHLIRDFRLYAQRDGPDRKIGAFLEKELGRVCWIHGKYREGKITLKQRNLRIGYCKRRVENWLYYGIANGSDQLCGLCERLLNDFNKLWTFTKVEGMEPTNNLAERDLRKLVIWRKKSFGTRSNRGQRFVERITSVAETAKRHGQNALRFIQNVVANFFAGGPVPYICENLGV